MLGRAPLFQGGRPGVRTSPVYFWEFGGERGGGGGRETGGEVGGSNNWAPFFFLERARRPVTSPLTSERERMKAGRVGGEGV